MSWITDKLYDTVFHVGDTTQQFFWDMAYGPENSRTKEYNHRRLKQRERRGETPLTCSDKTVFEKILCRYEGERFTDYWKRKKILLAHSNKKGLVKQIVNVEQQKQKVSQIASSQKQKAQKEKLEKQFRDITSFKNVSPQRQAKK